MESELYRDLSTDKFVRCFDPDTGITMETPCSNHFVGHHTVAVFSETQLAVINEMIDKRLKELKVQTFTVIDKNHPNLDTDIIVRFRGNDEVKYSTEKRHIDWLEE